MTILELAHQYGLNPKWKASTAGGEYKSPCPSCGGDDRFIIHPNKQMTNCVGCYWCRQCLIHGDAIQFARQFMNCSFQEAMQTVGASIQETAFIPIHKSFHISRPITLQKPSEQWITTATEYVQQAHERLMLKQDVLEYLAKRGLPLDAVQRYKFGWSDKDNFFSRIEWGLNEQQNNNGNAHSLWIPKGIVIPSHESSSTVIRLKVRRDAWTENDRLPKYVAISGSMNGLSLIGNPKHTVICVVESELDAYAIDCVAHDFTCVIAIGSNIKNPDNVTDRLARNTKHHFICHDNDNPGKTMLNKWQLLYPQAQACPTPVGKDIGEAIEHGLNIRIWLLDMLPPEEKHEIITKSWNTENQPLIAYALKYIREQTITREGHDSLEKEIALGPDSPRAKTGEMQQALKLLKQMSEIPN